MGLSANLSWFALVFVLLHVVNRVHAQAPVNIYWPTNPGAQCVTLDSFPNGTVPEICYQYITYKSVYIDYQQPVREAIGRLLLSNSWTTPDCVVTNFRIGCPYMFRPCYEVTSPITNTTVAVGGYVCRQECTDVYKACYDSVVEALTAEGAAALIPQATICDPPWNELYGVNVYGAPQYPNTTTYQAPVSTNNYTDNSTTFWVTLPCYDGNINITTPVPAAVCPPGLYFSADNTCALTCPEPILSASEFDDVQGIAVSLGWLSFLFGILLLLSFLLESKKRTFPHDLFIYFVVSVILLALSFVVGSAGYRNIDCSNSESPNTWGAGACTVQGIIYVYFSLTTVLWWLVIAYNYFLLVVMGYKSKPLMEWRQWWDGLIDQKGMGWNLWIRWESVYILYHIFAWGVPVILTVIALAAERIGYGGHDIWCTIHSGDSALVTWPKSLGIIKHAGGNPYNTWHLVLFDIPIALAICLGCGFLLAVVIVGIKNHTGKVWSWEFLKEHVRLVLFMGIFFWVYAFEIAFQIQQSAEREAQYDAYDDYINCSFDSVTLAETVNIELSCSLQRTVSFPLWVMMAINVASQGLIAFLVLGTTRVLLHQVVWFVTLVPAYLGWVKARTINGYEEEDIGAGGAEELGSPSGRNNDDTVVVGRHNADDLNPDDDL